MRLNFQDDTYLWRPKAEPRNEIHFGLMRKWNCIENTYQRLMYFEK